ncbi:DUF6049 family protein [Egicoccus sp. AB-alg6-2]|uniref:DUF6049 family protein n=1 Tax=Egicoccus sp. AB-alg6-2 TaxID=3242692 RepID=UPI00359DE712
MLAVVGLCLAVAVPAPAQTEEPTDDPVSETASGAVRLVISELVGVLGPGTAVVDTSELDPRMQPQAVEDLTIRVLVENAARTPLDRLRLVIQLHAPVTSRAALQRALDGRPDTDPQQVLYDGLLREGDAVAPGSIAGVSARFGPDDVTWGGGGVHPLTVAVLRGTEVLAQADTAVVWLDRPVTEPLLTSFVWPVDDRPWRGAKGNYPLNVDQPVEPGGRLDVLMRTLERNPDAPVVLAPAVHLLEDLRDRADGFTAVGRQSDGSAETRQVDPEDPPAELARATLQRLRALGRDVTFAPVTGTYADADITGLTRHGGELRSLGAEAAVEGRRRLASLLDRAPDAATHLAGGPLAPEVLDLVPGEQILLPPNAVDTGAADPFTALNQLRSASGRLFTGIVADGRISATLAAPPSGNGPVADVQRIVAETAQLWFQNPTISGRSLLLLPPDTWAPSAEYADRLLHHLDDASWLLLTTPSQQAALGRRNVDPLQLAETPTAMLDPVFAGGLEAAAVELGAVGSALPEGANTIGGRRPAELRDALLRATSRWYLDGARGEAEALVRDVHRTVEETFGDVVVASGSRVTLTSDTGQIPVTLQRTRGGPIAVRVEVASQGRLLWPDGQRSETIVLSEGAAQTVSFRTQALSTGTFSVAVRVTDPTGTHTLERTTLSVRSAAISGPALAATGAAVLLLLLAGAVRRRRPPRPRLEVVDPVDAHRR